MVRKKKSKSKSKTRKSKKKRKAFGGYSINFAGRTETLEEVFGNGKIAPSQMTKSLWKFIKIHKLGSK